MITGAPDEHGCKTTVAPPHQERWCPTLNKCIKFQQGETCPPAPGQGITTNKKLIMAGVAGIALGLVVIAVITRKKNSQKYSADDFTYEDYEEGKDWSDWELTMNRYLEDMDAYLDSDEGDMTITAENGDELFRTKEEIGWREKVEDFILYHIVDDTAAKKKKKYSGNDQDREFLEELNKRHREVIDTNEIQKRKIITGFAYGFPMTNDGHTWSFTRAPSGKRYYYRSPKERYGSPVDDLDARPGDIYHYIEIETWTTDKKQTDGHFTVITPATIDSGFYYYYSDKNGKIKPRMRSPAHSNMFMGDVTFIKVGKKKFKKTHKANGYAWLDTGIEKVDARMPNLDARAKLWDDKAVKDMKDVYYELENRNYHMENAAMVDKFARWIEANKKPSQFNYRKYKNMAKNI